MLNRSFYTVTVSQALCWALEKPRQDLGLKELETRETDSKISPSNSYYDRNL